MILDETTGDPVGEVALKLSGTGAFTGKLVYGPLGLQLKLKGVLDGNGNFVGVATAKKVNYPFTFQLGTTTGGGGFFRLTGTFEENGNTHNLSLDRAGFDKKVNPSPFAGVYTALIPADPAASGPQGDGFGLIKVGADGKVAIKGALGDAGKFTAKGIVSEDGEWRLFKELYKTKPKGRIGGVVTFRDEVGISDFDGVLHWTKFASAREKLFPDGFELDVTMIGSVFTAPAKGDPVLTQINVLNDPNATWQMGFGNVPNPGVKNLFWPGTNKPVAAVDADETLKISDNAKTGEIKGAYSNKTTKQKVKMQGAAFQKQGVISGNYFPGNGESGFFVVEPTP